MQTCKREKKIFHVKPPFANLRKGISYVATAIVAIVLILSFAAGYFAGLGTPSTSTQISTTTVTKTSTVYSTSTTTLLVPPCQGSYSTSGYCEAGGNPSLGLIERAFNYTSAVKLEIGTYAFTPVQNMPIPNGTLQMCLVNTGSEPAMISAANVLINNTSLQSTVLSSGFTYNYSSTAHYSFVASNETTPSLSSLVLFLSVSNPVLRDNYTLSIFGNSWTLKYGTSFTNSSSTFPC